MQNRSKLLAIILLLLAAISFSTKNAVAQAGRLDPAFGNNGTIVTEFGNLSPGSPVNGVPFAAVEQPDGKILVVGQIGVLPELATGAVALVRYLPNGTLDSTFGNGGIALAAFDNFINYAYSLALMPDGRIVAAGEERSTDGSFNRFGILRFNPNGTLDISFAGAGKVTTEFFATPQPGVREAAFAVVIQSDGKIVAGGIARQSPRTATLTALARYNLDGSLDNTFGNRGKVLTSAIGSGAQTLALLSNGHILVLAGQQRSAEFSADGRLQPAVTGGVIIATSVGGLQAFQNDDKFQEVRSFAFTRKIHIIQVLRFTAQGSADLGFNDPPFNFGGNNSSGGTATSIVIQPDGKSVIGGSTNGEFGIARLQSDGALDPTFGNRGSVLTPFPDVALMTAVALQSDGKILAVGVTLDGNGIAGFALARYMGR
jgi:uncharacterized delta-60 repeat protein